MTCTARITTARAPLGFTWRACTYAAPIKGLSNAVPGKMPICFAPRWVAWG